MYRRPPSLRKKIQFFFSERGEGGGRLYTGQEEVDRERMLLVSSICNVIVTAFWLRLPDVGPEMGFLWCVCDVSRTGQDRFWH